MAVLEQQHRSLAGIVFKIRETGSVVIVGEYGGIGPESFGAINVGNRFPERLIRRKPGAGIYGLAVLAGIGEALRKVLKNVLRILLAGLDSA